MQNQGVSIRRRPTARAFLALTTLTATMATAPTAGATAPPTCPADAHADAQPWIDGPTADAVELRPGVRAVVYPGPAETGNPWSQWGQGIVLADGRVLSAVGDHLGVDGNSYLYEFDPASGRLTTIADVLSVVGHQSGAWGYGKIHAPLVAGPCGEIYAATYWGTRRNLEYGDGYEGDRLLELDPDARTISPLAGSGNGLRGAVDGRVGNDTVPGSCAAGL